MLSAATMPPLVAADPAGTALRATGSRVVWKKLLLATYTRELSEAEPHIMPPITLGVRAVRRGGEQERER